MDVEYSVKRGGDVVIEVTGQTTRRHLHVARKALREQHRHMIIRELEERSGLPFHLAICAITRWKETEEEDPENFLLLYEDRIIILRTRCYVGEVRYPVEAEG